jgi:hypothetical protein
LIGTSQGFQNDSGLFIGDGNSLREIVREGGPVPEGGAAFLSFTSPLQGTGEDIAKRGGLALNAKGHVAFVAQVLTDGTINSRIYRTAGDAGSLTLLARNGTLVSGGNGMLTGNDFGTPLINSIGQVVFGAFLSGTTNSTDGSGVFLVTDSEVSALAAPKQKDLSGEFNLERYPATGPALNSSGRAIFGILWRGIFGTVFTADKSGITVIGYPGQPTPDGLGTLLNSDLNVPPVMSDANHLAFIGNVQGVVSSYKVLYLYKDEQLTEIARTGQNTPDNRWRFGAVSSLDMNATGGLVFLNSFSDATSDGIFKYDGETGTLTRIVARNQSAPDGNGTISMTPSGRFPMMVNNNNQVAFASEVFGSTGVEGIDQGIFFYDGESGLIQVARKGSALLGSTITELKFQAAEPVGGILFPSVRGKEFGGLNNAGQLAYSFTLADGRTGIAVWSFGEFKKNLRPTSTIFTASISQGQTLQLTVTNLLSVVSDPEGGTIFLTSVTTPTAQGRPLTYNQFSRIYSYSPPIGFAGVDEFSYIVRDEIGASLTVTGRITVLPLNRPPTSTNLSFTVRLGESVTLNVKSLLDAVTDPDGDSLALMSLPLTTFRGGTITRNGDVVTVAPVLGNGDDQFDAEVHDGRGGSVNVRVQIAEFVEPTVVNGLSRMRVSASEVSFSITSGQAVWNIERAEQVHGPWTKIGEVTVPPGGRADPTSTVVFRDTNPPARSAYYHAVR